MHKQFQDDISSGKEAVSIGIGVKVKIRYWISLDIHTAYFLIWGFSSFSLFCSR